MQCNAGVKQLLMLTIHRPGRHHNSPCVCVYVYVYVYVYVCVCVCVSESECCMYICSGIATISQSSIQCNIEQLKFWIYKNLHLRVLDHSVYPTWYDLCDDAKGLWIYLTFSLGAYFGNYF